MTEKELNRCKDFLDYFGVKWELNQVCYYMTSQQTTNTEVIR